MKVSAAQPFQIIYSLYEHEFLGYLFESFIVHKDDSGKLTYQHQNISSKNAREFSKGLNDRDFELIELMDRMSQDAILKIFSKKIMKPNEFFAKVYKKEKGDELVQETRGWNEDKAETVSQRVKETSADYRYFPDPDLLPVVVEEAQIEDIRNSLPELPDQKLARFKEEYTLPEYDAGVLTSTIEIANYFEDCLKTHNNPKIVSNWIMTEVLRELKEDDDMESFPITPDKLGELLNLIQDGTISGKIAKEVFEDMLSSGKSANEIVKDKGMTQISDQSELEGIISQILSDNPDAIAKYKAGDQKLIGFLVGQVMKQTQGKANPKVVNEILKKGLSD